MRRERPGSAVAAAGAAAPRQSYGRDLDAPHQAQQSGQRDDRRERSQVDPGGQRQAKEGASEQIGSPAASAFGDVKRKPEGQQQRHVGEGVHREEVRLLDVEHAGGQQQRRQQPHALPIQPPTDEEDQSDCEEIEQPRQRAANQMNLVVIALIQDFAGRFDEEKRESAIDITADAAVVGVERRAPGIEVTAPTRTAGGQRAIDRVATGQPDTGEHHGEEAFVGVDMLQLVPVQPGEAEDRAEQQDHHQGRHDRGLAQGEPARDRPAGGCGGGRVPRAARGIILGEGFDQFGHRISILI